MDKKSVIIVVLLVILIVAAVVFILGYFKGQQLVGRINQLEQDRSQMSKDKEDVMAQLEQCRSMSQIDHSKLNMLMEDIAYVYKTCITQNVCKGHYPNVRWNCNSVGDEINVNPTHICVCDSSCNLNATEIIK